MGNTHEVAVEECSQARVVYVDHDPIVLAHARSMLHGVPGTAVIGRDMLEPDSILADRSLRELIDFNEPVALLFLSILHFVANEADPAGIISRLLAPFPAGSLFVHHYAHWYHRTQGHHHAGLPGPATTATM